jgi:hypothetical protein
MRFIPEVGPLPGMSTQRSRGMDRMVTVLLAGSMRATIVTSLRWPPALASLPNARSWVEFLTKARLSDPTMRMLNGPGSWESRCLAWIFLIWSKRYVVYA